MADSEDSSSTSTALSIDTLSLNIDVNINKSTAKLRNFTTQLDKTVASVQKANPQFAAFSDNLSKIGKVFGGGVSVPSQSPSTAKESAKDISKATDSLSGSVTKTQNVIQRLGAFASIGKFYFLFNYFKQAGIALGNMVNKGIDFNETLNLWQVAMRSNISEARDFVSTMNQAYGIAEDTVMKSQATFKNMLSSLGNISSEASTIISQSLVQMSVDFASLYNVSLDDAITKFEAVLSGQVRPIRSIAGYDITENTVQELYKSLGGTKAYRSLSETEKRLLRIYAVFQQMSASGALGDMSKTLSSNANQTRIMDSQMSEISTWSGIIVSQWLQSSGILVTINSYLIAFKEIIKGIAYQLGYTEPSFLTGIFEDASNANEEVETLTKSLMGFDKFNVLTSSSASDSLDISASILKRISGYSSILDNVQNPALEKANSLLEQMGFNWIKTATLGDKTVTGSIEKVNEWIATLSKADQAQVSSVTHLDTSKLNEFFSLLKSGLVILAGYLGTKGIGRLNNTLGVTISNLNVLKSSFAVTASAGLSLKSAMQMTDEQIKASTKLMNQLSSVGIFLVITNVMDLVDNWKQLDSTQRIIKISLTVLGTTLIAFSEIEKYSISVNKMMSSSFIALKAVSVGLAVGGIALLVDTFNKFANFDTLTVLQKIGTVLEVIGATALIAAGGMAAFKVSMTGGLAAIGIIGGLAAVTGALLSYKSSLSSINSFANGGFPKEGQLFIANEAGPEIVGSMGNKTAVANNDEITKGIEEASYRGMAKALSESDRDKNISISIDGNRLDSNALARAIAPALRAYMKSNGGKI